MLISMYQKLDISASELQTVARESMLEDEDCNVIPLLHSLLQAHTICYYGKYCIGQSKQQSASHKHNTFWFPM